MMACFVTAGALLIVLLTGSSYGVPVKTGYALGLNLPSAGLNRGMPSSGYVPSMSGSGPFSNPARVQSSSQAAPDEGYTSQSSGQSQPAATYSSNSAALLPLETSSSNVGAFQAAPSQAWAGETPGSPSALLMSSNPEPFAPSYVGPPGYQQYQGGELSKYESGYEHGNSESETEEQRFQQSPPVAAIQALPEPAGVVQSFGPYISWPYLPYPYDYMFLTGQYPPGTFSYSSQNFEQGGNHWQDNHYLRYPSPAYPGTQNAPQVSMQPSQHVVQYTGSANDPYQGSYAQPGRFNQQHQGSSTGGHGMNQGGS